MITGQRKFEVSLQIDNGRVRPKYDEKHNL